jgi:hypothetical protein
MTQFTLFLILSSLAAGLAQADVTVKDKSDPWAPYITISKSGAAGMSIEKCTIEQDGSSRCADLIDGKDSFTDEEIWHASKNYKGQYHTEATFALGMEATLGGLGGTLVGTMVGAVVISYFIATAPFQPFIIGGLAIGAVVGGGVAVHTLHLVDQAKTVKSIYYALEKPGNDTTIEVSDINGFTTQLECLLNSDNNCNS